MKKRISENVPENEQNQNTEVISFLSDLWLLHKILSEVREELKKKDDEEGYQFTDEERRNLYDSIIVYMVCEFVREKMNRNKS